MPIQAHWLPSRRGHKSQQDKKDVTSAYEVQVLNNTAMGLDVVILEGRES